MRVAISGGTGLIGRVLAAALTDRGDEVIILTRSLPRSPGQVRWDPGSGSYDPRVIGPVDAVVNLAGAPVSQRWTEAAKREILQSRVQSTALAATIVADQPGAALINGSAVGIYGSDRGSELLTESSAPGRGFLAGVVEEWEAAAAPAVEAGRRVAFARSGIVLAPHAPSTRPLLLLTKLGLGGPMGSGRQFWAWVTLVDEVAALLFMLDHDVEGPFNVVGPTPATQRELVQALGAELRRPTVFPAPALALRLALGGFAGEVIGSQKAVPERLKAAGFGWAHPTVAAAARWLTKR